MTPATNVLSVTIGGGSPTVVTKGELPKTFSNIPSGTNVSYSYISPIASTTTDKRYRWDTTSGTGSASGETAQSDSFTVTQNSTVAATYKTQHQLTFAQSGIGGDTGGNTVVTVQGNPKTAGLLPFSDWFDAGSSVTYSYEAIVNTDPASTKRYALTTPAPTPASPITVTGAATVTGTYKTQYQLTLAITAGVPGGLANISGGTNGTFYDDNTVLNLTANTPVPDGINNRQWGFDHWSGDVSVPPNTNNPLSVTMDQARSILANYAFPTGTFSNNGPVNEASPVTISFTNQAHPFAGTTADGFRYAYACDNSSLASATYATSGTNASTTCTYPDNGTFTVKGRIIDSNDGFSEYSTTVTVQNVAPTVATPTLSANSINENSSVTLTGAFTDPGTLDSHTVTINWGDGSPNTTISLAAGILNYSSNHTYVDDNPTATTSDVYNIVVTVTDKDGDSGSNNKNITVNNVPPVITTATGPAGPQPINTLVTVNATFVDVGIQDTHGCSVNWDDGTTSFGTVTESNGSGTCTASHTYTSPGVYSAVVTITDDDTGSASRALDSEFIVIFDPSAGFVTGGGWIMSPAGACQLTPTCTTATGKANFGFVSKYKKGSNTPEGQTEFQFHAGGINFHSSEYEFGSLVISGYKAQYRGMGTINGIPGYKFVLTAYDGHVNGGGGFDRFRMKITKDGIVVYDNRIGISDDIDVADPTIISGGSIVIHKK